MEDELDIFILSYKDFDLRVTNPIYKIIDGCELKNDYNLDILHDNSGHNISHLNGFFSELTRTYWLYRNYPLKKYVGVCHYRRYFKFLDDIPNLDEIFKSHDIILPKHLTLTKNVYQHYKTCHNKYDLLDIFDIIMNKLPDYSSSCFEVFNNNILYSNNIFIMKREDFIRYCEFVFYILFLYLKSHNFKTIDDIYNYVENNKSLYLKNFSPNNEVWYQSRIGGFLAERLLTIFVKKNFTNPYEIDVLLTEKKYS